MKYYLYLNDQNKLYLNSFLIPYLEVKIESIGWKRIRNGFNSLKYGI